MSAAYFMGVHEGRDSGHCCRTPEGEHARVPPCVPSSWSDGFSACGDPGPVRSAWGNPDLVRYAERDAHPAIVQPEGIARLLVANGWTALTMWDRSGDPRKNSHASFTFAEVLSADNALARARSLWPGVWRRIDVHLAAQGLVLRLELVS